MLSSPGFLARERVRPGLVPGQAREEAGISSRHSVPGLARGLAGTNSKHSAPGLARELLLTPGPARGAVRRT